MSNRFLKIFLVFLLVLVGLFLIYTTVNAALVPCGRSSCDKWDSTMTKCLVPTPPEEMRPCTTCDLFALSSRIINFVLFTVVPAVAVLFYLIGGLMILLSRGDPGFVATGKNFFWNTTIGLFIIFGAWMITNTVLKSLVGDNDISNNWFRIECTSTVQQPPSTQTYVCSSENRCVATSSGTVGKYTTSNCNNECQKTGGTLSITTINLPDATVGQEYNHFVTVSGGTTPYTWSKTVGNLPPGLNLATGGAITGTPTTAGQVTFTIEVNDSSTPAQSATGTIKITVKPAGSATVLPLAISTVNLPDIVVNQAYSQTLQAIGGKTPYAWSKTAGNLPPGLTLSANGIITGTPTTANTHTFTVKVEDSTTPTKQSATKQLSIKIVAVTVLQCPGVGTNLCQASTSCPTNACSQYSSAIQQAANKVSIPGLNTKALFASIMFGESSCNVGAYNKIQTPDGSYTESCGPMQMQVATARNFQGQCGITTTITCDWLRSPANINGTVCLGAKFIESLARGRCGNDVRHIAAGYNGGAGYCGTSRDCAGEKSCGGQPMRAWECPYDNETHTLCNTICVTSACNTDRDHPGFLETRKYAPAVLACYNKQ